MLVFSLKNDLLKVFSIDWCLDSDFFINCGGPQIRSVTGKVFEKENGDLGSASSTVSYFQRWAVSSVGLFAGSSNNMWVINSLDSEIFQSARHSSSSLRYYGLGLENGGYTVTLQFAEIDILGTNSWRGLGTRRFNIYVQVCPTSLQLNTLM